jgi:ComF family protein
LAGVDYAWPWSDCISQFKFGQRPGWAAPLAQLLRSMPEVEPALAQADCVLPMPLSRQRLAERGYNQALLLARHLAPDRTQATLLLRIRHTAAQSSLHRAERLLNLQQALAVDPLRAHSLRGQRVVVVDDVMTTGASLHAAAAVLRRAGAAHITGLVLARTP